MQTYYPKLYEIQDANLGGSFRRGYFDLLKASIKAKITSKSFEDHDLRTFPLSSFQILRGPCKNLYWDLIYEKIMINLDYQKKL